MSRLICSFHLVFFVVADAVFLFCGVGFILCRWIFVLVSFFVVVAVAFDFLSLFSISLKK